MKGDFSQWRPFDPNENFNGVLHQQGRVLIDPDWNDHTRILQHWQGRAARDVIGDSVAAVPLGDSDGFKIEAAQVITGGGQTRVELTVHPGHVWADGLLAYFSAPTTRVAAYLQPPIQNPAATSGSIGAGVRDAVILEVSREALNGFQAPERLIEPALGGPDTTERIQTRYAFRLFRLGADEDCHTIVSQLKDEPNNFGNLSVSLQPTVVVPGDCPVVEGGGYTGFEHELYRIEIGPVANGSLKFKWSQFNGGLVGRGNFKAGPPKDTVEITANLTAIATSGLNSFYLEALQFDAALGQWVVTYGAKATLNTSQVLELDPPTFGTALPTPSTPGDTIFFRLWNGLEDISAFTNATNPADLPNRVGIQLAFDSPANKTYREGDYWVFPVRAGEIKNPQVLINAQPPQGIRYHRVALAELNWNAAKNIAAPIQIEDCRRPFRPLTKQETCCTFRVGDGIQSFGDFNAADYPTATATGAIQAAIDALPARGGQVCVLPGDFRENIVMTNRHDITITGCGARSRIVSRPPAAPATIAAPVIQVLGGYNITIDSLAVEADGSGVGILLEGINFDFIDRAGHQRLSHVTLFQLLASAAAQSAIRAQFVDQLTIRECEVRMQDTVCLDHAIFALGDDMLIERNLVEVPLRTDRTSPISTTGTAATTRSFFRGTQSRGGIQIGGTSDRVRIINNLIRGGSGDGITLGSLIFIDRNNRSVPPQDWPASPPVDPCDPATPANATIDLRAFPMDSPMRPASAGTLTEIVIERNRIYQMGMNGIGVVKFFNPREAPEFIRVENLFIIGNDIRHCLLRSIAPIANDMLDWVGYGGIALADVEHLVVRDNLIADNGIYYHEPVCGIFVVLAEGMEISRNRILDHGLKTVVPVKPGRIGGINIVLAVSPGWRTATERTAALNAEPAIKVEGNQVAIRVGRALTARAVGPLSIVANYFSTAEVIPEEGTPLSIGTVWVANAGLSSDWDVIFPRYAVITNAPATLETAASARVEIRRGLPLVSHLPNGNILFANNQCVLNLLGSKGGQTAYSIVLTSFDDVAFLGNQCECNLANDHIFAQAFVVGFSLRANDNRLKESFRRADFSALTLGYTNITAFNHATHCLLRVASDPKFAKGDRLNIVVLDPLESSLCERWGGTRTLFGLLTGG
jgi:uncharacterized protein DUF6519